MSARSGRTAAILAAAGFVLAVPGTASAHSRAPTIALDVRLRVDSIQGVRAKVIDGNRRLRLSIDPGVTLIVRGLLGEPVLRFGGDGVWVNLASPTTAADRISSRRGSGWFRLTPGRSYTWHDHRLAPPRGLPPGSTAPFALPVFINGTPRTIGGAFTYVARPAWWPWLVGAVVALAAALAFAGRAPAYRTDLAWLAAVAAAVGALVASLGFATAGSLGAASEWVQVGCSAVLVLLALGAGVARRSVRTWTASLIGAAAIVLSLREVVVFWHGVVISSVSPSLARLAVATAIAGGFAAAGVSFAANEGGEALSVTSDDARPPQRAI
jgi:hypothetical protein